MNHPHIALHPETRILLAQLHAFATLDEFAMYEWSRPRIDELRHAFYQSCEPTENFALWVRARYLNRKVAPESAPNSQPACVLTITTDCRPRKTTGPAGDLVGYMFELARKVLL